MDSLRSHRQPLDRRCLRDEPDLEALLGDEIMESVMRSAGIDRDGLRRQLSEIALRLHVREIAAQERRR